MSCRGWGMASTTVAVRLEQSTRVVLQNSVNHDLDGGRVEALRRLGGSFEQLIDLLEATSAGPTTGRRPHVR